MAIDDSERARQRALFDQYRTQGDPAARAELVAVHFGLARHLARRFANRGVSSDDLEQVAALGLVQAVDRFDPDRGAEFSTFATPTILGELKRHFRDREWSVSVPRRLQELHLRLNVVIGEVTHRLGRSPTIAELADGAQCSQEEVLEAMEAAHAFRTSSIDDATGSGRLHSFEAGTPDVHLFAAVDRVFVEDLLLQLPAREQLIIRLRFYEDMTQHEIAVRLGISQMHVSRLLARCLQALRDHIETARREIWTD